MNGARLKLYHEREAPKPSRIPFLDDEEDIFQYGTPSEETTSSRDGDNHFPPFFPEQDKDTKNCMDEGHESFDESIPPLPPPMPTLSQLDQIRKSGQPAFLPDDSIHVTGVTASTPVSEGGFFPDFFTPPSVSTIATPTTPPSVSTIATPTAPPSASTKPTPTQQKKQNEPAQQAMFRKRQLSQKHVVGDTIVLEDNSPQSQPAAMQQQREQVKHLRKQETDILLSETAWLTDTIIDAAQSLLKSMTPADGFQPVGLGQTLMFEIQTGEFIQILHCRSGHWLTVSTIGAQHPAEVLVYDSLYPCASSDIKRQIAALLATSASTITLKYIDVQMQSGTYDCGLFAIAFATALVLGQNPGQFLFDQAAMRRHLWNCLKNGKMTMFPVKKERRRAKKIKTHDEIPVFCSCRLPEIPGVQMIECTQCKMWYHVELCVTLDPIYLSPKTHWYCNKCKN